jgi:hypothetical protein
MPGVCASPPVNPSRTEIGRGFGIGPGRTSPTPRLHAGFDFKAGEGTPVIVPLKGTVAYKATEDRPRGTTGFGNMVALRHDIDVPGLPNPFWTSYNHLRDPSPLEVGQEVEKGTLVGFVGKTTNGQFSGMGPHLHFEVRRRNYPSSYDRDTIDPAVLWQGLGYEWVGSDQEGERRVGGRLVAITGGPSDCPLPPLPPGVAGLGQFTCLGQALCGCPCHHEALPGPCPYCPYRRMFPRGLGQIPNDIYEQHGESTPGPDVEPPDYGSLYTPPAYQSASSTLVVAGAALVVAAVLWRRR